MDFDVFVRMKAYPVINQRGEIWFKYEQSPLRFRLADLGFIDVIDSEVPDEGVFNGMSLQEFLAMKTVPVDAFYNDFGGKNFHLRCPLTGCIWSEPI